MEVDACVAILDFEEDKDLPGLVEQRRGVSRDLRWWGRCTAFHVIGHGL